MLLGAALTLGALGVRLRDRLAASLVRAWASVTLAVGGHAAGSPLTSVTLAIHLLAAVTWLGAAPAVALVLWDRSRRRRRRAGVRCVASRDWRTVALVVLIAAGSASALLLTNGLESGDHDLRLDRAGQAGRGGMAALLGVGPPGRSASR